MLRHKELKMRCDLGRTGANAHKLITLYCKVIYGIELYNEESPEYDEFYLSGVKALHELNDILKTNFHFNDLIESYNKEVKN